MASGILMETQDSLDIRGLKQLILGPIPEAVGPRGVHIAGGVVASDNDGSKLDDANKTGPIACESDNRQPRLDHDNARARARPPQTPCPEIAAEKVSGTQSNPLPKRMSTQGSEEKTQEFGEEELTELVKKVQNEHAHRPSDSDEDEPGNIDLLRSFEQSHVDRYDAEDDNDDDLGGELQVRAEIFPESKRFQNPTTPAMSGKKQVHDADTATPGLPVNPFISSEESSTDVMSMSQLFKYTQPSSPHRRVFQSDPASEFPSPVDFKAFRSPALPTSSSPMIISAKDQAPVEQRPEDTGTKGSKNRKARRARGSAPSDRGDEGSSDDGFDSSAEKLMFWKKREKQKIEEETRKQFEMVKAPSREAANTKGKRQGRNQAQYSGTKDKRQRFPLIPENTAISYTIVDENTENEPYDDAQAQAAKPRAVLDEQATTSHASVSTYHQRPPQGEYLEDTAMSASPLEQPVSVEDGAGPPQPAGPGVCRVVEVEDSQPSLSQVRSGGARQASVPNLQSLPSSFGSGFVVSRSQDDSLPLPPHTNPSSVDEPGSLPQRPASSSVQGDSSSSQDPSRLEGYSNQYWQSQAADGVSQDLAKRQTVIECSSPRLPTAPNPTECGCSTTGTTLIGNVEAIAKSAHPLQHANESRVESLRTHGMRTPTTTKPLFSINETTIPETSPAGGYAPLHERLDQTPPIPPPKDDRKWSQGIAAGRHYTIQSSDSNLFETARSQLSPADPMGRISESSASAGQVEHKKGSEIQSLRVFATGQIPLNRLGEDGDVVTGNSQHNEDEAPTKITPLAPARKRRKGARGRAIPEGGTKTRVTNKAAKTSENDGEPVDGRAVALDGAPTADKGEPTGMAENTKASSRDARPGAVITGSIAGGASKKTPVPKTAVSGTTTSRTLRTDGAFLPTTHIVPEKKGGPGTTTAGPGLDPGAIEPNRVLALFKNGNLSYYPATCRFLVGVDNPRFKVRFDDGTEDILESQHVRSFDLRVGDIIKVDLDNMRMKNYVVYGFQDRREKTSESKSPHRTRADLQDYPATDIRGYSTVLIKQKQRDSLPNEGSSFVSEEIRVPISSVYIPKSMWHKFDDRIYTYISDSSRPSSRGQASRGPRSNPVTPTRAHRMTPTFSVHTDPSGPASGLAGGIFKGMVFAVSYLKQDSDKEQIIKQIVGNGGRILEDGFEELFQPDWFAEVSGDSHSFRLKREAERLGFACVIANAHSRKPKFLGALALGLPCLHGRWIQDCTSKNEIADWDPYLLPSGESSYLGGSTRSRILQPYPPLTAQLPKTIASRPKPLRGQSVILVMGKGKAEDRRKTFLFLVFALGASKVHQVPNIESARRYLADPERGEENWDWICVNERDAKKAPSSGDPISGRKRKRESESAEIETGFSKVKIMSDDYVMQTVVMGRLMAEV